MGKKLWLVLPITWICFLFAYDFVYAQEPTNTPEPTITPTVLPGYIPTILPPLSYAGETNICPDGVPQYYGVKTPSPLWMIKCAHCLPDYQGEGQPVIPTPEGFYSEDDDFFTELIAGAGTKFKLNGAGDVLTEFEPDLYYSSYKTGIYSAWSNDGVYLKTTQPYLHYVNSMDLHYEFFNTPNAYAHNLKLGWKIYNFSSDDIIVTIYSNDELNGSQYTIGAGLNRSIEFFSGYTNQQINITRDHYLQFEVLNGGSIATSDVGVFDYASSLTCSWSKLMAFVWTQYPVEVIPDSACDSITGEGEDGEEDYGFTYDGITYGTTRCENLGPYDYEILGVVIGVPYIAYLCVQEIGLGTLALFGVVISLDAMAFIMMAAMLIRNLFIS